MRHAGQGHVPYGWGGVGINLIGLYACLCGYSHRVMSSRALVSSSVVVSRKKVRVRMRVVACDSWKGHSPAYGFRSVSKVVVAAISRDPGSPPNIMSLSCSNG